MQKLVFLTWRKVVAACVADKAINDDFRQLEDLQPFPVADWKQAQLITTP